MHCLFVETSFLLPSALRADFATSAYAPHLPKLAPPWGIAPATQRNALFGRVVHKQLSPMHIYHPMFARSARLLTCSRIPLSPIARQTRIYTASSLTTNFRTFGSTKRIMSSNFDRLIRFTTPDGKTEYGNLEKEVPTREIEGSEVELLEGDVKSGFKKAGGKAKVGKLLCPLKREEINIILCVGLNYGRHAEECNVSDLIYEQYSEANNHSLPYQRTQPSS